MALGQGVRHSAELSRVLALPRRDTEFQSVGARLSADLSPLLKTPEGTETLRPLQAVGLNEAWQMRGLFTGVKVGGGKTLLSYLIATIFGMANDTAAHRPLLLVPAYLREKTLSDFGKIANHWRAPRPPFQVWSYTALDIPQGADRLDRYQPTLIVADEADELKNPDRTCCKRIDRHMKAHPETVFCAMCGTLLRKSLHDIAHLLRWALKENAPIPLRWVDLEEWANAIDEKVDLMKRSRVGALTQLVDPKKDGSLADELKTVRAGFRRRLQETPGVIIPDTDDCDRALTINTIIAPPDKMLDEAFHRFRTKWETPDGWALSDPLSVFRHGTELSCGFFYKWDPRPPEDWITARSRWYAFVRQAIEESARSGRPIDTKGQVAQRFPDEPTLIAWREIEKTFIPNTVAVWFTSSVLGVVTDWLRSNHGIVWVNHVTVGETLSRLTNLPYFGAGGKTAAGDSIERCSGKTSIIASINSNKKGRNLQNRFHRNLVIAPPKSARDWEQKIGRTHRAGQKRDVFFDVVISSAESLEALEGAYREACFVQDTQGQTQKILRATINHSFPPAGFRWTK